MRTRHLLTILLLTALWICTAGAEPFTPAPGSPERKAICDAVREHVVTKVAQRRLPMKVVFQVGTLRVEGAWAWFEGFPVQANGNPYPDGYLPPIDYNMVLQRSKSGWRVVEDQSRGDVPSQEEVREMMARHPNLPLILMPKLWRTALGR